MNIYIHIYIIYEYIWRSWLHVNVCNKSLIFSVILFNNLEINQKHKLIILAKSFYISVLKKTLFCQSFSHAFLSNLHRIYASSICYQRSLLGTKCYLLRKSRHLMEPNSIPNPPWPVKHSTPIQADNNYIKQQAKQHRRRICNRIRV